MTVGRTLKWAGGLLMLLLASVLAMFVYGFGARNFGRVALGIGRTYDTAAPSLPQSLARTNVLIFSKTNGYRDDAQIVAANAAIAQIARAHGWSSYTTENGAVFNPAQLGRFQAVVWNSVSGDVLTASQRAALRTWLERGGGFVGLHGAGGDPGYAWRWYVDDVIGAQFIGHTMGPQFQPATLVVEDRTHPATRQLGANWQREDEWYSFAASPRRKGYRILVSIDEKSYRPEMTLWPFEDHRSIRMGQDHPMVWAHCVNNGRVFYSALGHRPDAYREPPHRQMIAGAIAWAAGLEGSRCSGGKEVP